MMLHVRLQTIKHFALRDFFRLLAGKVFPYFKSEAFMKLQQKEIKLDIVYRNGLAPVVIGNRATFTLPFHDHPLKLQLDLDGSDVLVFNQVLVQESYKAVVDIFQQSFNTLPKTIVDAGANIGLATLYFAIACPHASVVAIEPNQQNFNAIRLHVAQNDLKSINVRHAALWPENRSLSLVNDFRDRLSWSVRVEEQDQGEIVAITPADAVSFFETPVDLFKIDIEGGESQLFKHGVSLDWLRAVKMVAIEVHEEYIQHTAIIEILERHDFQIRTSGELTMGINLHFQKKSTI